MYLTNDEKLLLGISVLTVLFLEIILTEVLDES